MAKKKGPRRTFRHLCLDRLSTLIVRTFGPTSLEGDEKYLHFLGMTKDQCILWCDLQGRKLGFKRRSFLIHWTMQKLHSSQIAQDYVGTNLWLGARESSTNYQMADTANASGLKSDLRRLVERMKRQTTLVIRPRRSRIQAHLLENLLLSLISYPFCRENRFIVAEVMREFGVRKVNYSHYWEYVGIELRINF